MSERFPGPSERRGWHHRGASSPTKPVVLDGRSARGLLALLASSDHEGARGAHEQLVAALGAGRTDAIRAAMDRARTVLPPEVPRAEVLAAELAAKLATMTPTNEAQSAPEGDAA